MDIINRGCEEVDELNLHIETCFLYSVADLLGLAAIAIETSALWAKDFTMRGILPSVSGSSAASCTRVSSLGLGILESLDANAQDD
jgi:hypothetical protein